MSVVELDIYSGADPNGTPLVTLTDEDVATFKMRKGENELGAGEFSIRRDHADATEANLASGNYVKVRIPAIQTDPVFAFWIDEHSDKVLAAGEEGEEVLTRNGPGPLFILRNAAFLDQHYAPAPPASDDRGNDSAPPGYWMWARKQYGQILKRFIEEGQNQPGTPLLDVTTDFDRGTDSDGVDWPDIIREVRFPIGTDGLAVFEAFASTGELWVRVTPDLLVSAYYLFRGTDRTSATFASGKVRFVKGVNINTELVREGHGVESATHALVIGTERLYRTVVSPDYVPGTPGRWITVNREEFNDVNVLDKVGTEALVRAKAEQEAFEFEIEGGFDEANGLYMPFEHFDTGDLATVHTGTDPWDYNEYTGRITGFRLELREASRDETIHIAARSLKTVVEIGGASRGFGNVSVPADTGCCPEPEPYDPTSPGAPTIVRVLDTAATAGPASDVSPTGVGAAVGDWTVIRIVLTPAGTIATPAGWTAHPNNGIDNGLGSVHMFYKAGDGTSGTVLLSFGGSHRYSYSVENIENADQFLSAASDSGTGTALTFGEITGVEGAHHFLIGMGIMGLFHTVDEGANTDQFSNAPMSDVSAYYIESHTTLTWPGEYEDPMVLRGTASGSSDWAGLTLAFIEGEFPVPGTGTPVVGEEVGTGDGAEDTFVTALPWVEGSLRVMVDGLPVDEDVASSDPVTKTFTLDFTPLGVSSGNTVAEKVTVDYLIA